MSLRDKLRHLLRDMEDERIRHSEAAEKCDASDDLNEANMNREAARVYGEIAKRLLDLLADTREEGAP
jgi:hypothetical protein